MGWDDVLARRTSTTAGPATPRARPAAAPARPGPPTQVWAATGAHPMSPTPPDPWHGTVTGPFTQSLWVWVPQVRSKSNFRRYRRGTGRSAAQQAMHAYQDQVAATLAAARPASWDVGAATDPVAARPTVLVTVVARTRVDAGNVPKSILDAGEGPDGLYLNDASVRRPVTLTEYRSAGPGGIIAVATIGPNASLAELHEAGIALDHAAIQLFTAHCPPT